MKKLLSIILSIMLVSFLLPFSTVMATPAAHLFYGGVTIDGSPAPGGTSVTATMSGYSGFGTSTIGDYYEFTIDGDTADAGKTISFYVNGIYATSASFVPNGYTPLNLSVTSPPEQYTLSINTSGSGSTSGAGTYNEGTVVNITANPAYNWEFVNWTGDTGTIADVNDSTTTITMNGNYSITANFVESDTFSLLVYKNGSGSTTGTDNYDPGEVVQITATPDEGWSFVNWTGNVGTIADVNASTTTITMNGNYVIYANFVELGIDEFVLTMDVTGNGSTIPGAGSHIYTMGEIVDITAIPAQGWQFDSWSGDVTDPGPPSTTVTMDSDKTITANFSELPDVEYTLTIDIIGSGSTIPSTGSYTYAEGTVVNINAIPTNGWQFDSWSGDVSQSNSASTTVTMDSDKTITANFSRILSDYSLSIAIIGSGNITPSLGSHTYNEGTVVNITATPNPDWQFEGWSGDTGTIADVNDPTTTITINCDCAITANFSHIEDVTPPSVSGISVSNIGKTCAEISWSTDEPGDSQVEYRASPGQLTPLDTALVTEHTVWLTNLMPATTYYYKVLSRDQTGNLTTSDEYTFTTLGLPATFDTGGWEISLTDIDNGKLVDISFSITNIGDLAGGYQIAIEINDVVEVTEEGSLNSGSSETLSFTRTIEGTGKYEISINDMSLTFEISKVPSILLPIWLIIILVILFLALIAISIVLFIKKRKIEDSIMPGNLFLGGIKPETAAKAESESKTEAKPEPAAEEKSSKEAIEVKESSRSLTVTPPAIEKLKEALQSKTTDPEFGFRLIPSPLKTNQLKMTIDRVKEDDLVIEKDGAKILILSPEVVAALGGMVMDYQETDEGGGFSISEVNHET